MSDTIGNDLSHAVHEAAKGWKKEKRHADKNDRVSYSSLRWMRSGSTRASIRDAAFAVMEAAYQHASGNGKYYANARQIMYAARPLMLANEPSLSLDGKFSIYFTQVLLKDYLEENCPTWKVVWDARGHLVEPYTKKTVGLGGIEVMQYIKGWNENFDEYPKPDIDQRVDTSGPVNRFGSVLFIEKEGFTEILKDAEIGRKYDLAMMSTKGLPVKAACDLANAFSEHGVQIYVLHDFDLAGFKIVKTLREGTRMAQGTDVVDLGLRLADVTGLEDEPVEYKQHKNPAYYLKECGASQEERDFLVEGNTNGSWFGRRVELNAMTSDQLIAWLKKKLKNHGVKKVIPEKDVLASAYRRAKYLQWIEEQMEEMENEKRTRVPSDLREKVKNLLKEHPTQSWDEAIWTISGGEFDDDDDEEDETPDEPEPPTETAKEPEPPPTPEVEGLNRAMKNLDTGKRVVDRMRKSEQAGEAPLTDELIEFARDVFGDAFKTFGGLKNDKKKSKRGKNR